MITSQLFLFWILSLVAGGAGAYLGAYLKYKGQNLATREDIADITKAQKEIEAMISDRSWDRQKHWEIRKEAALDLVKTMGRLQWALLKVKGYKESLATADPASQAYWQAGVERFQEIFSEATSAWDSGSFIVSLSCGPDVRLRLDELTKFLKDMSTRVFATDVPESGEGYSTDDLRIKIGLLLQALRADLLGEAGMWVPARSDDPTTRKQL